MLKRKIFAILGISSLIIAAACNTSRVIQRTDKTAVIQGRDASKAAAIKDAEMRAEKMFGKFKHTKPPECQTGETSDINKIGGGSEYGEGHWHWDCVITVEQTQ